MLRIALYAPPSGEPARLAEALERGLRARGDAPERFGGVEAAELSALAELFEGASRFDAIHLVDSDAGLAFANLVESPILATVFGAPEGARLELHKRFEGRVRFIAPGEGARSAGLAYAAVLDPALAEDELAEAHRKLYERAAAAAAREDKRPWGYYKVLEDAPEHKIKRIVVEPGERLSLQLHHCRTEHWTVVRGEGVVTRDGEDIRLRPGESVIIPQGAAHRIRNDGQEPLVFVEIQSGTYFGEDDIVRLQDDYGRAK